MKHINLLANQNRYIFFSFKEHSWENEDYNQVMLKLSYFFQKKIPFSISSCLAFSSWQNECQVIFANALHHFV